MSKNNERNAKKGNEETFVRALTRELMQQDSSLLQREAAEKARDLYARCFLLKM